MVWHPFTSLHSDRRPRTTACRSLQSQLYFTKSTALTQTSSAFASARVHWAQPPKKGPSVLMGGNDGGGGGGGNAAQCDGRGLGGAAVEARVAAVGAQQRSRSSRRVLGLPNLLRASSEAGTFAPYAAKSVLIGESHASGLEACAIARALHETSVAAVPSKSTQFFPPTLPPWPTTALASAPTHGRGPLSATPSQAGFGGAGPSSRTIVK